jgi:hypothetical protein
MGAGQLHQQSTTSGGFLPGFLLLCAFFSILFASIPIGDGFQNGAELVQCRIQISRSKENCVSDRGLGAEISFGGMGFASRQKPAGST